MLNIFFAVSVLAFIAIWVINIISVGFSRDKLVTSKEGPIIAGLRLSLLAASVVGMIIFLTSPKAMAWASIPLPATIRWIGFAVTVIALVLFGWVLKSLGHNFSTSLTIRQDQTLIETGPYKWVRHPMYTAFILIWTGFLLHSANWFIGMTGILCFLMTIWVRTPLEEKMMIEKFGQKYVDYMNRTGRFLPKISR